MHENKEPIIIQKTVAFSVQFIPYYELLEGVRKFGIARQLLTSGTSIGAIVNEAQSAKRKADFIPTSTLATKETNEAEYWLLLCEKSDNYPACDELQTACNYIIRKLSTIISSSKNPFPH